LAAAGCRAEMQITSSMASQPSGRSSVELTSVGIVGGGKGGLALLKLLAKMPSLEVVFVTDPNDQAPGVVEATQRGIRCGQDVELFRRAAPDYVVEATGRAEVIEGVKAAFPDSVIIPSQVALFLFQCFEANNAQIHDQLVELQRRSSAATDVIAIVLQESRQVMMQMRILAMNAQVEAAHAGATGRGFAVLAGEMKSLADSYQASERRVEESTKQAQEINESLLAAISRLAQ
jgi:hypothetical protein